MKNIKLVCFDVDGTLVDGNSWTLLTEGLGCSVEKHMEIYHEALEGTISFSEAERRLTQMYLDSRKAVKKFILGIFQKIEPRPEAYEFISYLLKKKYPIYLISGGNDIYVKIIAEKLKVDGFYANSSLEFEENGVLKKIHYRENQGEVKVEQLMELTKKLGVGITETVFVGDSKNDIEVFKATGKGIAVGCDNEDLIKAAWKVVGNLKEVKGII